MVPADAGPVVPADADTTGESEISVTSFLSAIFVARSGAPFLMWHPTPIEALAPPAAECASPRSRGLETQSCPRTGLLMTIDVACARPLSPGSGEGPPPGSPS